jgi:predicted nucleic acid-binding protein
VSTKPKPVLWASVAKRDLDEILSCVRADRPTAALRLLDRIEYPRLAQLDLGRVLALFEQAEVVEPEQVPAVCRDPDDDPILACAAQGRAEFLVTEDLDLLDLGSHRGMRIGTAAELLARLESD